MTTTTLTSKTGNIVALSAALDSRIKSVENTELDGLVVFARNHKAARELTGELQAWGLRVELDVDMVRIAA
jgi:hypothetical protein